MFESVLTCFECAGGDWDIGIVLCWWMMKQAELFNNKGNYLLLYREVDSDFWVFKISSSVFTIHSGCS